MKFEKCLSPKSKVNKKYTESKYAKCLKITPSVKRSSETC